MAVAWFRGARRETKRGARAHLVSLGPFGPRANLGPGQLSWAQAHLGLGPLGPGLTWAWAHLGLGPLGPGPTWDPGPILVHFGTLGQIMQQIEFGI